MFPFAASMLSGPGFAPLGVSLSGTTASGSGGSGTETTGSVVATVSGGSGSVSFLWSRVSGDSSTTANSSTSSTTSWTRAGLGFDETEDSVWHCTVTDLVTAESVTTANVSVSLHRNSAPPPIIVTLSPGSQTISVPGGGTTHVGVNASYSGSVTGRVWGWSGGSLFAGGGGFDDFILITVSVANGGTTTGGFGESVSDGATGASGSGSASFTVNGF